MDLEPLQGREIADSHRNFGFIERGAPALLPFHDRIKDITLGRLGFGALS